MSRYILILGFVSAVVWGCKQDKKQSVAPLVNEPSKLVEKGLNVGIVIMNGTYNTELTAPMDIFHHTKFREGIDAMNVFTLANTFQTVRTFEGLVITPDFNYTQPNLPKIDILVVPSAEHHLDSDMEDVALIQFILKADKEAKYVTSHCDGAFILAKAGVLDQVASTTFPGDVELYKQTFPNLDVHDSVLFVHDGKYITSAGGAKSFEAALYLCETLYGKEVAEQLAKGLVIDWDLATTPKYISEALVVGGS